MPGLGTVGDIFVRLRGDTATLEQDVGRSVKKLTSIGASLNNLGNDLTRSVTLPIVGLGFAVTKLGGDFESSFAGIIKTVDDATDPLGNLTAAGEKLRQGMRDLAKDIPISVNELNNIGEAAGQLGVQTANIVPFVDVMAKLGATTNLSSTEAATALARFDNITGGLQSNFDRIGSTVVALGNNFATTEAEIVELALRLSGAGTQIGLTQPQILGFAAALSSVGVQADAGGTAFSRVFSEIEKSVALGDERLTKFAAVAGMSGETFRQAFREDAAGAIQDFVGGLSSVQESGGSVTLVLDALGLSSVRLQDSLKRAANAGQLLPESLELANKAFAENIALNEEFEKRVNTFQAQLTLLKNRFVDIAITLFDSLRPILIDTVLPLLSRLADMVAVAAAAFDQLPQPVKTFAVAALAAAAAIGPLLILASKIVFAIKNILALVPTGVSVLSKFSGAWSTLAGAFRFVLPLFRLLIGTFSGPAGWIALIVSSIPLLARLTGRTAELGRAWDALKSVFSAAGRLIGGILSKLFEIGKAFATAYIRDSLAMAAAIREKLAPAFNFLRDIVGTVVGFILDKLGRFFGFLADKINALSDWLGIAKIEIDAAGGAVESLGGAVTGFVGPIQAATEATGELVPPILELGDGVGGLGSAAEDAVPSIVALGDALDALPLSGVNRKLEALRPSIVGLAGDIEKLPLDGLNRSLDALLPKIPKQTGAIQESSKATREAVARLEEYRKETIANIRTVRELAERGLDWKRIARATGIDLAKLGEAAREMGVDVDETTAAIIRQSQAADEAGNAAQDLRKAWQSALGDIVSRFTKGFTDMLFTGKKFSLDLKGIFKNLAKTSVEILIGGLVKPFVGILNSLATSLSNFVAGGLSRLLGLAIPGGGGGGGGILSNFGGGLLAKGIKGLGGLLGIGGGAATGLAAALGTAGIGALPLTGGAIGAAGGIGAFSLFGPGAATLAGGGAAGGAAAGGAGAAGAGGFSILGLSGIPLFGALAAAGFFGTKALINLFSNSPTEAGSKEIARDFGIQVGESAVKGFIKSLGLSDKQFEPSRKSILGSPKGVEFLIAEARKVGPAALQSLVSSFGRFQVSGAFAGALERSSLAFQRIGSDFLVDLSSQVRQAIEGDFSALNAAFKQLQGGGGLESLGLDRFLSDMTEAADETGRAGEQATELGDKGEAGIGRIEAALIRLSKLMEAAFTDVISRLDALLASLEANIDGITNKLVAFRTEAAAVGQFSDPAEFPLDRRFAFADVDLPSGNGTGDRVTLNVNVSTVDAEGFDEVTTRFVGEFERRLRMGTGSLASTVTRSVQRTAKGINIGSVP